MAIKTLHVKQVSIKEGKNGKYVTLQDETNKWYSSFDSKLIGKIYAGGELKVDAEQASNPRWNDTITKWKVIESGKEAGEELAKGVVKEASEKVKETSKEVPVQQQIQKNFDTKVESILRQVALKEASKFVSRAQNKDQDHNKTPQELVLSVFEIAEDYLKWLKGELAVEEQGLEGVKEVKKETVTSEDLLKDQEKANKSKDNEVVLDDEDDFDDDPFGEE